MEVEGKVQEEVKVRGKEWVVQVRGQARDRAGNAFARSVGRERRIKEEPLALNMFAPSAGQR